MSEAPLTSEAERADAPSAALRGNVFGLGLVSLFTDVSTEMVVPVMPLFITATLGASIASLGLIEGVAGFTAAVLRLGSGWLSDRVGRRKPFLVFGYAFSGVSKAVMGLASTWPVLLALRFADRLGKGLRNPPRDALLADSAPANERGRAFGFHRAMDTAGAAIGALTGGWLLSRWSALGAQGYARVFYVSAIPAAISVLVLLVLVREAPKRAASARAAAVGGMRRLGGRFWRFVCADALFQLGNSSNAFLLLRAQRVGFSAAQVAFVYLGYNVLYAALAFPFGRLSDRVGRRPLLVIAYVLYAASYAIAAKFGTPLGLALSFGVLAVHSALLEGQASSLLADVSARELRATAYGAYYTVVGLALLPASIVAGLLWERVSPAAPFVLGAGLAAAAAVALCVLLPPWREAAEHRA